MSESQHPGSPTSAGTAPDERKTDTARREASGVKDTAANDAAHVADTAKDEAGTVAQEAKTQVRDLYAQTQHELREQAGAQQERVAHGMRAMSDELGEMSRNSSSQGVASDLVSQASTRLADAADWLGRRDPGSLLHEVKSYARRNPGTFIVAAGLVGVAAGRLTRALASDAHDDSSRSHTQGTSRDTPETSVGESGTPRDVTKPADKPSVPPATPAAATGQGTPPQDTPVYADAARGTQRPGGL
ncbi:hypothetical protein M4I32_13915 [Microbacterium sp. LRZ72]|uniref:hypothetical protein n=1 Tax=Microbacterium sp. LRZ72 TaxID=2942481 RepID=UPI0029B8DAD1|nr:hypothetical protein [Microbacterium sp. LRZ72]MDX2377893.1 hypothetical protein [Microbacterium sp. LRZ72]